MATNSKSSAESEENKDTTTKKKTTRKSTAKAKEEKNAAPKAKSTKAATPKAESAKAVTPKTDTENTTKTEKSAKTTKAKSAKSTGTKSSTTKATKAKSGTKKTTTAKAAGSAKATPAKNTRKKTTKAAPAKEPEVMEEEQAVIPYSLFTEFDIHLFKEGKHYSLYQKLGSHIIEHKGTKGVYFAVWAPNAESVSVIGDFNGWEADSHQLHVRHDSSGIWEGFIPRLSQGSVYKYHIKSQHHGYRVDKCDPYAFHCEVPPKTASIVWDINYEWKDKEYLGKRREKAGTQQPMSVYELHMGSWKRVPDEGNRSLTYKEMAEQLPQYLQDLGYTHVEFMPVMEHPFYGSWGYQVTGYFAASSRYGTPQDLMYLIEQLHKHDIGVILDWVPSHFPGDEHGLAYFDGTHLFEHSDPRKGFHPDWNSYIFNYGRNEIKSFLISNALFWLDKYHADGLRVDAVASMLYLDYSRKEGEWIPNEYGGNENLEAIEFIKEFNTMVYEKFPDVHTIAEESTAWPMVSKPVYVGGLGFGKKWMMGWMHDTLQFLQRDPIYRKYHQGDITFSFIYAFHENFLLPLSHDEVVYGKQPLIYKMPGDEWQRFANLRLLYGYMYAHSGKKLLFMGGEFGQTSEWNHESSLDWHLMDYDFHKGVHRLTSKLNQLYKQEKSLYELDYSNKGFEWIDFQDADNNIVCFMRKSEKDQEQMLVVCNFNPLAHESYRVGVPVSGRWQELLNTDHEMFGGSNVVNAEPIEAVPVSWHGRDQSITLRVPPLGVTFLKLQRD
jgi:1,4-alpha-glucan branching enzyme